MRWRCSAVSVTFLGAFAEGAVESVGGLFAFSLLHATTNVDIAIVATRAERRVRVVIEGWLRASRERCRARDRDPRAQCWRRRGGRRAVVPHRGAQSAP